MIEEYCKYVFYFSPNKTPIEVVRSGAFGGACFRDIYSGINEKWYKT